MKIIVINGRGGVGKDEFVKWCREANNDVYSISSVDYVKEIARLIGWNGEKDVKGRKFLSDLKDALSEYNDAPFKRCVEEIKDKISDYNRLKKDTTNLVFFVHVREPKEIDRWKEEFNAQTVLIRRPEIEKQTYTNHADLEVMDYDYDYTYWNIYELPALRADAKGFMYWLMNQKWESKID